MRGWPTATSWPRRRGSGRAGARWRARTRPRRRRRAPACPPSACASWRRDFAAAEGAAAYGRTGSCLGRFGTLVAFLLDALNAVTGNLDRPGGSVFGRPPVELDELGERLGLATYGKRRSRIGGFPDVIGNLPAVADAARDRDAGRGPDPRAVRLRRQPGAVGAGRRRARARARRARPAASRSTSTSTRRTATPTTCCPPRPSTSARTCRSPSCGFFTTPFIQVTEAVVDPPGEARQEWEIIDDLARAHRRRAVQRARACAGSREARPASEAAHALVDLLLRTGPRATCSACAVAGSASQACAAIRTGWCSPTTIATGVLRRKLRTPGRRVHLRPPEIVEELARLARPRTATIPTSRCG